MQRKTNSGITQPTRNIVAVFGIDVAACGVLKNTDKRVIIKVYLIYPKNIIMSQQNSLYIEIINYCLGIYKMNFNVYFAICLYLAYISV